MNKNTSIDLSKYKAVSYGDLMGKVLVHYTKHKGNTKVFEMAQRIGVQSTQSLRNCLNPVEQKVSDEMLTGLFKTIAFDALIVHKDKEKHYYIKNK